VPRRSSERSLLEAPGIKPELAPVYNKMSAIW
jgi:hypothetical protein